MARARTPPPPRRWGCHGAPPPGPGSLWDGRGRAAATERGWQRLRGERAAPRPGTWVPNRGGGRSLFVGGHRLCLRLPSHHWAHTLPASFLPAPLVNGGDQLDRKARVTPHCLGLTLGFQGFRGTGPLPLALQTSGPGPGSHTAPPRRGTSSLWDTCWPQTPLCLSFLLCPRHEWEGRPWGELACPPGLTPTPGPLAERGEAGEEGSPAPACTPSASCLLLPVIDAAFFVCFRNQR